MCKKLCFVLKEKKQLFLFPSGSLKQHFCINGLFMDEKK